MKATGQKLLRFDRRLGARFVAGADEAGRGSLAGPLVVAGVLLDYACLKEHRVRPLTYLNDSKQCSEEMREHLYRGVLECAERVVVRADVRFGRLRVTVRDNGRGFPREIAGRVTDPGFGEGGAGLGLAGRRAARVPGAARPA